MRTLRPFLAALASSVELIRDQQNNAAQQLRDEFAAGQERNQLLLTTVLKAMEGGATDTQTVEGPNGEKMTATKTAPPAFDTQALAQPIMAAVVQMLEAQLSSLFTQQGQNFQAILEREREVNEDAMARLNEGLAALQQNTAPQGGPPQGPPAQPQGAPPQGVPPQPGPEQIPPQV